MAYSDDELYSDEEWESGSEIDEPQKLLHEFLAKRAD
jgi:hypothetical protein